jgi:hypothetical protein
MVPFAVSCYVLYLLTCFPALHFSAPWCCDRHSGNNFDLPSFFPSSFFTDEEHALPPLKRKRKSTKGQNCPTTDRKPLLCRLRAWRSGAHLLDPLRAVRPISFICDDKSLVKLSTVRADKVTCVLDIVRLLEETDQWAEEWGGQIFDVIRGFDKKVDGGDENSEEDAAEESEDKVVSDDAFEDEIIVPRKRARVTVAPSRVPVLVSITNSLSRPKRK